MSFMAQMPQHPFDRNHVAATCADNRFKEAMRENQADMNSETGMGDTYDRLFLECLREHGLKPLQESDDASR